MAIRANKANPTKAALRCDNSYERGNLGDNRVKMDDPHHSPATWMRAEGHRFVPYCESCLSTIIDESDFDIMPAWRVG